jgi:His/Glu/Gln/Arg/opine family amino acid ABC transporter permease subunit
MQPDAGRASRWVRDTRWPGLLAFFFGVTGLLLALVGPIVLFAIRGMSNHELVAETLKSTDLRAIAVTATALGGIAVVLGASVYRRMDTRVAREQAIAGSILGVEAGLVGLFILFFTRGEMDKFALNFLNFPDVTAQTGTFLRAMKNTLILTFSSTLLGISIGLFFAVLSISKRAIVRAPARVYINVIRGTPLLVLLAVFYFGFALGLGVNWTPFVALIVVLAVNHGATSAEIFRAGMQSIERGQLEAARSLGLGYMQSLRLVIIPLAFRRVIPPLMNEFIAVTKDTSLIVFLGVSLDQLDLFSVGSQGYSQYFNATFYIACAIGYLVITLPLIALVNYVDRRLRSGLVAI